MLSKKDFSRKNDRGQKYFYYECECGSIKEIREDHVNSGKTVSCGCFRKETSRRVTEKTKFVDGVPTLKHPLYSTWKGIKERCYSVTCKFYKYYGGRGITVSEEWLASFETFVKDIGNKPKGTSLDRINNDKGYSKDNCRWATAKEQANNRRLPGNNFDEWEKRKNV